MIEDFKTGTGDLGWRLETDQYTKQRGGEAKSRRKAYTEITEGTEFAEKRDDNTEVTESGRQRAQR